MDRPVSSPAIPIRSAACAFALLLAGCATHDLDETGGLKIVRSTCPAVAIPSYTGDVTLFTPPQSRDVHAHDLTATITNLRSSCDQTGATVHAQVTFDVLAQRGNPVAARDVVLPYFASVVRGGNRVVSKQLGRVLIHFDAGSLRGTGTAAAGANIDKASASLPQKVADRLNRKRKAGDADASIDPMNTPEIRSAVREASFELLVGFQLDPNQLAYNATR